MSTSYDGSLLDHLAEYMIYLSTVSSFWFSLDSSYNHEFHLSKRFGMSPQDYEHLLVAAHLAHFHTKWGFSIKKLKWKLFFEGHLFATTNCTGTFEVDVKKLDFASMGCLQSIGWLVTSFGLAFCISILPETLRCRKIVRAEWCLLPHDWMDFCYDSNH